MLRQEACDLAVRILGVFHGPQAAEWEDELQHLDAGTAGTTFVRLRREHTGRWLSIADFHAVYRTLRTDDASTKTDPCDACGDSGWLESAQYIERDQLYTGARPCSCSEGRKRAASKTWTASTPRNLATPGEVAAWHARQPSGTFRKDTA
ncbi:MAG: hypothetical protein KA129_10095 [Microthrixaceae bacterium]|jgi:hypothetical protein|nr:hypothetical protein [Microthrixaceae bacterium]